MKNKLCILGLLGISLVSAQNIGINTTEAPQETLDVEGTVRLKTPGPKKNNAIPLGVTASGKVIAKPFNQYGTSFGRKTIRITTGSDGIKNGYDTKIPTNDKNIIISSVVIKRQNGTYPIFRMLSVQDGQGGNTSNKLVSIYINNEGRMIPESKKGHIQGLLLNRRNATEARNPILFAPPYAYSYQGSNGNWHINVGVAGGGDIDTGNLIWTIEVLVIDKSWSLFSNTSREYEVGNDSKTLTRL
ncbi:MAG: hypothetical protein Q4A00_05365 [Flavobacteriaceae bacterium]|nr:hypothetical protein [Flavobacteriaceae bacterium]